MGMEEEEKKGREDGERRRGREREVGRGGEMIRRR